RARMRDYMQSRECLMLFLARELDDESPSRCRKCAICNQGPLLPETYSARLALQARERLRRVVHPIYHKREWPAGALSAHGWHGGQIEFALRAQEGRALSAWGDGGWSDLVRQGKQVDGRFDE